ncbi:MAG: NUDIX domain-containing protein [Candidatus Shapirobacteria bacterium]|jgi:8-oxo-dGTP diphosphatase
MDNKHQKVTVAGFLVVDGKALIVRRSANQSFLPGWYEIPGGKINFGEDPKEALIREFKEETNLKIKPQSPYRVFHYLSHQDQRHTVEIVYLVDLEDNIANLKLGHEHDSFAWITPEDIINFQLSDEIKADIEEGFNFLK